MWLPGWYNQPMHDAHYTKHALLMGLTPAALEPTGYCETTGRIQVFPAGTFAARDGRPACLDGVACDAWRLTAEDADALVMRWRQRQTPVVVDYEHQTHLAERNGQPAPAAGWIRGLEIAPTGIYADVDWTARARAAIRAREYQYISPVFAFDRRSGQVLELISVALTNHPALDGLEPARATQTTPNLGGYPPMDTLLALLRSKLGLPAAADADACATALTAAVPGTLADLLKGKDDALATAQAQLTAAKSAPPDPGKYVTLSTFDAVQREAAALRAQLAELQTAQQAAALAGDIEAALKDGRLAASAKAWAEGLAKSHPECLQAYLKAATPIPALAGTQTATHGQPGDEPGAAALTAEDQYVCAQLGISAEEYAKAKAKEDN